MADFKQSFQDMQLPAEKITAIMRGTVESNKDPLKAGRCKIRVFGLHTGNKSPKSTDGIPTEHLPWAEPCNPIFGGISKVGIYGVPEQGAHVFLFFEAGNISQPRYFATAPGIPKDPRDPSRGFYDPDDIFPTDEHFGSPDWNEGIGNTESVYPNSFVIGDKAGSKIEFDSTPGKEKIIIEHGITHSKLTFDSSGVNQSSGSNSDTTYTGSKNNVISGDMVQTISGVYNTLADNKEETILGNSTSLTVGVSEETTLGTTNKRSGSLSWSISDKSEVVIGGNSVISSAGENKIKSTGDSVLIEALLLNIKLMAELGEISSSSMTLSLQSLLTATLKGELLTSIGGGLITRVTSSAITQISGSVILIG